MNTLKEKLIEYRLKNPGKLQSMKDKDLYKELIDYEEFKDLNWKEKAYSIIHGPIPKCICGNTLKLRPPTDECLYGRPAQYCSNQCRSNDTTFKEKVNISYIEKYGSHPFASEEVKNKIKKTNLERYGTENASSSQIIKDKISVSNKISSKEGRIKAIKTNLGRYGVENVYQSDQIKEKIRQTNLERYGIMYAASTKESRLKAYITGLKNKNSDSVILEAIIENDKNKLENRLDLLWENAERKVDLYHLTGLGQSIWPILKEFDLFEKYQIEYQNSSASENEVHQFIRSLNLDFEVGNRTFLENKKELDILIHSHKLAIEFDGMYWHSHNMKGDKNYHLDKTNIVESKGYQLLHIFENEWIYKQEIWKSIIKAKLGIFDRRIYARKCQIKEILPKESRKFLDANHLAGFANSSVHLGLFYENELVSVMSYGKSRFNTNDTEVIRFATLLNTQIIGGFSKLLKLLTGPIVCFADRRISSINNSSNESFFDSYEMTSPAFWIIEGNELKHRLGYTKQKLMLYPTFDNDISTFENLLNHHNIIYDCGNIKYSLNRDT